MSAETQELARLLGFAHAPGPQMAQAAEQLYQCEARPGFGVALLQVAQGGGCGGAVDPTVQQAGAIYLKNFIKRRWSLEQNGVPAGEREVIREALLPLTLRTSRPVQVQLLAALEELANLDFPDDWPTLLTDLSRHLLASEGPVAKAAVLEAAHAVFERYRKSGRCADPVREARSCAEAFGPAHLQVWRAACEQALGGCLPQEQHDAYWKLLRASINVFHDLHALVLPSFFCEHREVYLEGFIAILGRRRGGCHESGPGPLDLLHGDLCALLALYASRYEEQLGLYIGRCMKVVWDLIMSFGEREEFDSLVATGISFLTAAAAAEWPSSPFGESTALQAICERIVLPNVRLRASDVRLFREEPQEYIAKDVEGGDEETRRRSAMDLVRALRISHNAKVCEVLVAYVGQLLEQAQAADEEGALLCRDACMHLVIAMAGPATAQGGLNAGIVEQFFASQVAPELQAEQLPPARELLRATCLKYVTVLRTVLPGHCVLGALPAVSRHIFVENPVVHTYAALCMHLAMTVRDRAAGPDGAGAPRFSPEALRPTAAPMVLPMLQTLAAGRGIHQNEFLARALVTTFVTLGDDSLEVAPQALQLLARVVAEVVAPNPRNAECAHACFECCAVLLKLLVPRGAAEVEGVVLPMLATMWEKGSEETLPYCFQLFGLLLDLVPAPAPDGVYAELFARALGEELWRSPGNVPGLIRLLRAYFARHAVFGDLLRQHMQAIFERFHFALQHKRLSSRAFELLNATLRLLPPDFYHQYFQTAVALALARIQAKKVVEMEKELVISLSLFVHLQQDPEALPGVLERIQPGLLPTLLTRVWLPSATKVLLLQRRKVCVVGLAKLMSCAQVRSTPALLEACCECLAGLLRWKNAGLMCWLSSIILPRLLGDEPSEAPQYEAAYCRLQHAEPPGAAVAGGALAAGGGWDLLPEVPDRAAGLRCVRESLAPVRPAIEALPKVPPALGEVWR